MSARLFTVRGRGEFPRDMLRYDGCTFATDSDEASAGVGYVSGARDVSLRLDPDQSTAFKPSRRWESFGWTVVVGEKVAIRDAAPQAATEVELRLTLSEAQLVQAEMQFGVDVGSPHKDFARVLKKVKRAIAKATGGAS